MFWDQKISIYKISWVSRGERGYMVHLTFFVYYSPQKWKPILKSNCISFWFLKIFPRMNNKKVKKMGPQGALLLFIYKVSIVVLIDFIAILVTPGIFLIQIVNTSNTNMYLIHFHIKNNFKMCFHKSWVFKVQTYYKHSLSIAMRWNKLRWHQQRLRNNASDEYLIKNVINNYNRL